MITDKPITRDALPEDLSRIVDIYNQTIPSRMVTADLAPVSVQSRYAWFAEHTPVRRPLWVVEQGGRTVGWLSFQSFYGRPAYDATAEISLYLDAGHRGRGLGRWLLQRAIDHAPGVGLRNLLGFIFLHNTPSLALFERFGFTRWGTLPYVAEFDGVRRTLVIVGLALSESAATPC
jgi:L-amino acid N-acyltransferase YncA